MDKLNKEELKKVMALVEYDNGEEFDTAEEVLKASLREDENPADWGIIETLDTVEALKNNSGTWKGVDIVEADFGKAFVLRNFQKRKGDTRGEMYIVDFGHARGVMFR